MKLIGKVPVEPLDDERLTNIERNLVVAVSDMRAPAPTTRRALAFAAVAMAIALAGFAGWKLRKAPATETTPQSLVMKSDAKGAMLDLGDAQLASMPGTEVRIDRSPSRTSIEMTGGALSLTVEHKPGRLLVVRAGDTEIEDVGTQFSVSFDGKSHVEVRVTEGEVKVRRAGKDFAVTAMNAWTTELGTTTIAQLDTAAAAVAQVDSSPGDIDPNLDSAQDVRGTTVRDARVGSGASGSAATSNAATGSAATGSAATGSAATGSSSGSGNGSVGKKPHLAGPANARKALDKWPYTAPIDVGTEDMKAATSIYLERIQPLPEGEERAMLLYSIAVVQHRAKHDKAALHTLTAVTKRNGGESKAYKAGRWLEVRIRCLSSFDDACRIAAERYRNQFPSGSETGIVDQILREIAL
jgi:hypothetical protein